MNWPPVLGELGVIKELHSEIVEQAGAVFFTLLWRSKNPPLFSFGYPA